MATKDISDVMVCRAYQQYRRDNERFPYEILMAETGECFKVCYAACERADRRDLIDYGVSLRTGWLTEDGEALLRGEK